MNEDKEGDKTFVVTKWGTLERQIASRSNKPAGLGIKDEKRKGNANVRLVYTKRIADDMMVQQKLMHARGSIKLRKSNVHESFNSVSLLDYIEPTEGYIAEKPDITANTFNVHAWRPIELKQRLHPNFQFDARSVLPKLQNDEPILKASCFQNN